MGDLFAFKSVLLIQSQFYRIRIRGFGLDQSDLNFEQTKFECHFLVGFKHLVTFKIKGFLAIAYITRKIYLQVYVCGLKIFKTDPGF